MSRADNQCLEKDGWRRLSDLSFAGPDLRIIVEHKTEKIEIPGGVIAPRLGDCERFERV